MWYIFELFKFKSEKYFFKWKNLTSHLDLNSILCQIFSFRSFLLSSIFSLEHLSSQHFVGIYHIVYKIDHIFLLKCKTSGSYIQFVANTYASICGITPGIFQKLWSLWICIWFDKLMSGTVCYLYVIVWLFWERIHCACGSLFKC